MRKVLLVTGSRGEYGYIRPILKLLRGDAELEPHVIATNMHLLPEFGSSVREFQKDEIPVHESILMSLAGYTPESMAKSLGVLLMSLVDAFAREKPAWVLLAGDRGEQLMGAVAASYMNIPVAHIQAGELSGNIDGMARHAITKFVHLHFASNRDAAERLRRMGEEEFRIHTVGAPQLDGLTEPLAMSRQEVVAKYGVNHGAPFVLVLQHPVVEEMHLAGQQMQATLQAVVELDYNAVVIYPNNDAGSVPVQRAIENLRSPRIHVERTVSRDLFASLMASADAIVGNSSAGILEAPSFRLPAVNIGRRQEGRLQGANVINCGHDKEIIKEAMRKAVSSGFRRALAESANPYGDGRSSARIIEILKKTPVDDRLLVKRMTY
ncbi:MAG: UDP-N-acetylglucosamine 2-epimerase (hydrolyzing) [Elusimicrobia bacterium]|nr:UDP-N-acetylglucosamine 2-epimerase (hydrolyzing) [Elusimicrobiota bacterium]